MLDGGKTNFLIQNLTTTSWFFVFAQWNWIADGTYKKTGEIQNKVNGDQICFSLTYEL